MDNNKVKRNKNYDRVMPRVFNRSRSSLLSSSHVTRHNIPPSVRDGAKPMISNSSSTVYNELPTVLNDYVPDANRENTAKPSFVVKPRRTIKSLDPAKSPQVKARVSGLSEKSRKIRAQSSAPSILNRQYRDTEGWSDTHVRGCYSSSSHTKLIELKDEIKAYHETEKLLKLRSKLYKSCGVVLDDVGQVTSDKAVQAALEIDTDAVNIRSKKKLKSCDGSTIDVPEKTVGTVAEKHYECLTWLTNIGRPDLNKEGLKPRSYAVCEKHFDESMMINRKHLRSDAIPTRNLPSRLDVPSTSKNNTEDENIDSDLVTVYEKASTQTMPVKDEFSPVIVNVKTETPEEETEKSDFINVENMASTTIKVDVETNEESEGNENELLSYEYEVMGRFNKLVQLKNDIKSKFRKKVSSFDFNLFALNLRLSSPANYQGYSHILNLPSETILKTMKLHVPTKLDIKVLACLISKLKSLPEKAKYCTLIVDKIRLERSLYYDITRDTIIGLHDIIGKKTTQIASCAYVIMIRGIAINWNLPIAYTFLNKPGSYKYLYTWITNVISQLSEVKIKVMAIVSNPDCNFDILYKKTLKITDVIEKDPYLMINNIKVYIIFNMPHLLKCLRNDLITVDFHRNLNRISWKHIKAVYSHQVEKDLGILPNVTEKHVYPNEFDQMRVDYAAQIFSRAVYGALREYIYIKFLPVEAKHTAEFILLINNLFDILNSSKSSGKSKYQTPFVSSKEQLDVLNKAFELLKNLQPYTRSELIKTKVGRNFKRLLININSVIQLSTDLKAEGIESICTKRLNIEPIEIFFEEICAETVSVEPTAIQFQRGFSKLFLRTALKNWVMTTRQFDPCEWIALNPIHIKSATKPALSPVPLHGDFDYRFNIPKNNGLEYVASYLVYKCSLQHECSLFKAILKTRHLSKAEAFAKMFEAFNKESPFYGKLSIPPQSICDYITQLENKLFQYFDQIVIKNPGMQLMAILKGVEFEPPCFCFPTKYFLKLYIRLRIFSILKYNIKKCRKTEKNEEFAISENRYAMYYINVKKLE